MTQIPAHAHCEVCQKVVAVDTRWCGEACEAKYQEGQRFKKVQTAKTIGIVVLLYIVLVLFQNGIL